MRSSASPASQATASTAARSAPPANTPRRRNDACMGSLSSSYDTVIVSRSVRCRLGRWRPASPRSSTRSSRASIARGLSSLARAAASSIASGSPSRRRQIATTSAALAAVTANCRCDRRACWTNSCTAGAAAATARLSSSGRASGRTKCSCSASRWRGRRDVAMITERAATSSRRDTNASAPSSCSRLSSTYTASRSATTSSSASADRWSSGRSSCSARVAHADSAVVFMASGTKNTPSARADSSFATATASRVLPAPPVPVSVTSRASPETISPTTSATSSSRPMRGVADEGSRDAAPSVRSVGKSRSRPSTVSWKRRSGIGKSLSRWAPRSSSRRLTDGVCPTRAAVLDDTITCPPCAAAAIRAARCTSRPTYPSPCTAGVPVCMPIRTRSVSSPGQGWAARSRCACAAASTASGAVSNTT